MIVELSNFVSTLPCQVDYHLGGNSIKLKILQLKVLPTMYKPKLINSTLTE